MIVKCEQCQTRFKIPDDKVTDKGVKVRCTKCGHTFRVTRDQAQPATATAGAGAAPAAGADPFAKFGTPASLPPAEVTRPGVFALGVEATRAPDKPAASAAGFDFSSLAPPTTVPTMPAVPAFVPPAAAPAPPSFDFSNFSTAATQPVPALQPRPPPAPAASLPPPPAFDFSSVAPPSAAPAYPQAAPAYPQAAPAAPAAAFDFAQVAPPAAAPAAAFDFAQAAPPAAAFDFAQVAPPAAPAAPASSAPFDFAQVAAPAAAPAGAAAFDFGGAGAGGGADGFFGSTPAAAPDTGGADPRAMFDMPAPPPAAPAPSLLDVPPPEPEAPRRIERTERAAPAAPPVAPAAAAGQAEGGRRRSVVGIVVNVFIAALLVLGLVVVGSAYLNEGKLSAETLSLENLKNTFAPSVEFVAADVSNGLYETRSGRSVFFVRGEVQNRSEASVKVVVKAELVDDGKVVRANESFAGEPATPEELFLIDGADALEALKAKVERRALVVPPGSAASFVVPFTEYPPDLKAFRVRVSARAVPAAPTAANP